MSDNLTDRQNTNSQFQHGLNHLHYGFNLAGKLWFQSAIALMLHLVNADSLAMFIMKHNQTDNFFRNKKRERSATSLRAPWKFFGMDERTNGH